MGISEEDNIQLTNKLTNSYNMASPLDVGPTPPLFEIFRFIHPVMICVCLNLTPVEILTEFWDISITYPKFVIKH